MTTSNGLPTIGIGTTGTNSATSEAAAAATNTPEALERAMAVLRAAGIGFEIVEDSHCPPRAA
jgi:hypothetical protein